MSGNLKHIESIPGLIIKYLHGNLCDSEYLELMDWCNVSAYNRQLFNTLSDTSCLKDIISSIPALDKQKQTPRKKSDAIFTVERPAAPTMPEGLINCMRYLSMAFLAGLLILSACPWIKPLNNTIPQPLASYSSTLTLPNGQLNMFDDARSGTFTDQGTRQVTGKKDSPLPYAALINDEPGKEQPGYNTLITPLAGVFHVELPDHSKVWLNNESSLRYPTHSDGQDTRTMELTGEAYFDIQEDELAWKNGLFSFHDDDRETVMRQLARWYDVEVAYEGKRTANLFTCLICRDNQASEA
jgi:hypothetical protein